MCVFFFFNLKPVREQGTGVGGNVAKLDHNLSALFSDHESQVSFKIHLFAIMPSKPADVRHQFLYNFTQD